MDRYSHIALAEGLLKVCDENTNMAYLSVIPLIDGEPSFLHRLHCHPLVKGKLLMDCALNVFGAKNCIPPKVSEDTYEFKRLNQEKEDLTNTFVAATNKNPKEMAFQAGYGALLSIISHSYFDTYNNAVQAFAPYESYCAGQYDMWSKVDYFNYRIKWYEQTAPEVRKKVLAEDFWNVKFTAEEMVKGLIHRIAALTQPQVKEESIKEVEKVLGVNNIPFNKEVERFYIQLENAVQKYLVESVQ
ncbi:MULTISPECIES: hypothetical protein [Bacillus]|uniref:Uncharacterized protein n=1 Tax=Bacillus rugosus TaxID=2715209 RepID=A0ACD3ZY59_9BACI|nr:MULTISPECIES: hypothetical protein [Bacillus]MBY4602890.1 hypothetical protein [Bacillus sp. SPARC3]UPV78978.1 hypothetical protein M0696_19630 [Bacillus rugosus]